MVKFVSVLSIEPYELFKPANSPSPAVSAIFAKYNDDVTQAVSSSLKRRYTATIKLSSNPHTKTNRQQKNPSGTGPSQGRQSPNTQLTKKTYSFTMGL